jgi:predicted DNA-binding transcriptional regulator AlpA
MAPEDLPALLLSDAAAAAWLGISRATFWRRVNDGTMPRPIKIGGATRWRLDELRAAVDRATAQRDGAAA